MTYNPHIHNRQSIRLKGYDYSKPGAYFVTILVKNRECLFGEIKDASMILSDIGQAAEDCWHEIPQHYPNVRLDKHVIMPNHVHGIIWIVKQHGVSDKDVGAKDVSPKSTHDPVRAKDVSPLLPKPRTADGVNILSSFSPLQSTKATTPFRSPSMTLGSIIRGYKIGVTNWCKENLVRAQDVAPQPFAWQRSFHDHIIRNNEELHRIRKYIENNPSNWETDDDNPVRAKDISPLYDPTKGRKIFRPNEVQTTKTENK